MAKKKEVKKKTVNASATFEDQRMALDAEISISVKVKDVLPSAEKQILKDIKLAYNIPVDLK